MNTFRSTIFIALLSLQLVSCSFRKSLAPGENQIRTEYLEISANWVKDKGKKFDIEVNFSNPSDKGIIIMLGDVDCSRGGLRGSLKHTFFNTGERTIDLKGGEVKTMKFVCKINAKTDPIYGLTVSRIYENKENDGFTKGKVIATNIAWSSQK